MLEDGSQSGVGGRGDNDAGDARDADQSLRRTPQSHQSRILFATKRESIHIFNLVLHALMYTTILCHMRHIILERTSQA